MGAGGAVVAGADDGVGVVAVVPVAVGDEDVAALPDVDEFADPLPSLHDVARSKAIAMTPGTAALSLTRATIPGPLARSSAVRAVRAGQGVRRRMRPSWTTDATSRPSRVNTDPRASPRPPDDDGVSCAYKNHSSARNERWNHIA